MTSVTTTTTSSATRTLQLAQWHAVPEWQKEPFILTGYRKGGSLVDHAVSVLRFHNSTLNIWTHLLGCFVFLYLFLSDHWTENLSFAEQAPLDVYKLSAVVCFALSSLYHTFNHFSHSVTLLLYRLDLLGICILIGGSFFVGISHSFSCPEEAAIRITYLAILFILLTIDIVAAFHPALHGMEYHYIRAIALFATVAYGIFPASHWLLQGHADSINQFAIYLVFMFVFYGLGFAVYALRVPERVVPGTLDYVNSHVLWHLLVLAAASAWYVGMAQYTVWRAEASEAQLAAICGAGGAAVPPTTME